MRRFVKEKANITALIALAISITGTAFSIFQWWNNQRDARIAVLVDLSRTFIRDLDEATGAAFAQSYVGQNLSVESAMKVAKMGETLEYIAFLANKGKIDKSYLAPTLVCIIVLSEKALRNVQVITNAIYDVSESEIVKFASASTCEEKRRLDQFIDSRRLR